ncbi:MAG: hypothetical protein IJ861_02820 [Clostridia bacterium]|nr:hypothetical protein [Clostridia bacterium]
MLKLPVCPHCRAVFTYKEVSGLSEGSVICYYCGKKFRVRKRAGKAVLMLTVCMILIGADIFTLFNSEAVYIPAMAAANAVIITAAFIIQPLTVRFIPEKITKSEKRMLKNKDKKHGKSK